MNPDDPSVTVHTAPNTLTVRQPISQSRNGPGKLVDYTIPQGQGGTVCQTHMHTVGREDEETEWLLQQPHCMLPSDFIDFFA